MRINRFFLFSFFCFSLTNFSQAADLESGEGASQPSPMHPVQTMKSMEITIDEHEPVEETATSKVSTCRTCVPITETLIGAGLNVASYGMIAVGGIMAANPSWSTIGIPLLGAGASAREAGGMFFANSQKHAAQIEQELDDHVAKVKFENLSPQQVQQLSDAFFETSNLYKAYLNCGSRFDGVFSKVFKILGVPVVATGFGFMLAGDHTVGPILMAAGVAARDLASGLEKRAEILSAQKKRIEIITAAHEKARRTSQRLSE